MITNPTEILKASEKIELNAFIQKHYNKFQSIKELKTDELNQILKLNQESYDRNINLFEITEFNPMFNHILTIPETDILTPDIESELIETEAEYLFNLNYEYSTPEVNIDCILTESIFKIFMQEVERQHNEFNYENGNLIITDLFNFLNTNIDNDIYLESGNIDELKQEIIKEIQNNKDDIIYNDHFYYQLDYDIRVYSEAKDQYIKIQYSELEDLKQDLKLLENQIKEYLCYNTYAGIDPEYYQKLTTALLTSQLTKKIINPIRNYTSIQEVKPITRKYLECY